MKGISLPEIDQEQLLKIKSEKINEIINVKEVKELIDQNQIDIDFIKRHLYYFVAYLKDYSICNNCIGPSQCQKKGSHLMLDLNIDKDHDSVSFRYLKCPEEKKIDKVKKKFLIRQFENQYLYFKFKDCLTNFAVERHNLVSKLVEFKNHPSEKGIYISGDQETGKSFILKLFSVYLAKQESTNEICFIDCQNEFSALENLYMNSLEYFNYYIDQMKKVQYLFLDDLGKEFKNDFVLNQILIPIITYRFENNLATFISSNYSINDLKNAYSYNKNNYKMASQLASMINKMTVEKSLKGISYTKLQ